MGIPPKKLSNFAKGGKNAPFPKKKGKGGGGDDHDQEHGHDDDHEDEDAHDEKGKKKGHDDAGGGHDSASGAGNEHGHGAAHDDGDDDGDHHPSGDDLMYDDEHDHVGGHKSDKGVKADVKKAEEDAADHTDDEIEDFLDGYDPEEDGNPPSGVDEGIWNKAKSAVEPKWDDYDEPHSVVAYVYKAMGGAFKKKGNGGK